MTEFATIQKKRSKVAICGFAGTTRHLAPFDDDEFEIWGLNEAHRQPWMKRITRWFQIHPRWDFTKQNNISYKEHWEWLKKKHPFPIYMQKHYDDIPSSIEFPLDQIVGRFLMSVKRGTKVAPYAAQKELDWNRYFTSSFAFMCSLALLEGFKTIHVYGFEMATETEYKYQKGSTEYWLGLATALCDEVYIPFQCRLLDGKIYGYEVNRMINRQRLEFLKGRYNMEFERAKESANVVYGRRTEVEKLYAETEDEEEKKMYALRSRDILQTEIQGNSIMNEKLGRVNMIMDLIKTVDNMHIGKDPGDGYYGNEGDRNEEAENAAQRKAEQEGAEATPIEPSEG